MLNKKKILLINPPFARIVGLEQDYVPLALWHISTLLKQQGFDPYIKNLNITQGLHYVNYLDRTKKYGNITNIYCNTKEQYYSELDNAIKATSPDIIGFTILTPQIKIANDLIHYIRTSYDIPIFCGGSGATLNIEKIYGCKILFQGGINNLSILNDIDEFQDTPVDNPNFSLDNYDGNLNFDNLLDNYNSDGYGHTFSSVGCVANCRFCASPALWHRKVYFKSIQSFIKELNDIAKRFNPNKFLIWDENFTISITRLKLFCDLYKLDTPWSCDSRIDSLNEDKIKLMKEHGCYQINIGAESGCQRILNYLNKGIDKKQIRQTIDLLNKYDLKSKIYMIMGFPEETYADMLESIEFIKSCGPSSITLSLFTPYLNTSLYRECEDRGLIDNTYDESNHSHQSETFLKMIHPEININVIIKMVDNYNKGGI
jgi:anaerobic magnesium-protoporphyrin IX monomethyl ester cyclase